MLRVRMELEEPLRVDYQMMGGTCYGQGDRHRGRVFSPFRPQPMG